MCELYFNTAVQDGTRISDLMQYFKNSTPDNESFGALSDRVKYFKEDEEGIGNMCEAVKNYGNEREALDKAEGRAEGKAEGRAEERNSIAKALLTMGTLSVEDIAKVSQLSVEEVKAMADN